MPAQRPETRDWSELAAAVGGLAHEIKNPLSTINLNLDLLKEDWAEPETPAEKRSRRKIEIIQREIQRLNEILNSFLQLVRVQDIHLTPQHVNAIVDEMLHFVAPEAAAKGVEIVKYLGSDLPPLLIDAKLFKQAMLNLVLNAEDAMEGGGQLTVRTCRQGDDVCIELTDTGKGIAPDALGKIFDAYYSTKKNGTGLGLPTTRWIIRQHGGTIEALSEPGRGSRFIVRIPVHQQVPGSAESADGQKT